MTEQICDKLLFSGASYPLDEHLLPCRLPGILSLPVRSAFSALWWGYIATLAVRDGHLWLDEVKTPFEPDSALHDALRALSPAGTPCA